MIFTSKTSSCNLQTFSAYLSKLTLIMASNFALALLPVPLVALSAYTLYHSYNSIQNVRAYEEPAERAAKYSNIAEDALNQTRTTEGAGAIAVCISA